MPEPPVDGSYLSRHFPTVLLMDSAQMFQRVSRWFQIGTNDQPKEKKYKSNTADCTQMPSTQTENRDKGCAPTEEAKKTGGQMGQQGRKGNQMIQGNQYDGQPCQDHGNQAENHRNPISTEESAPASGGILSFSVRQRLFTSL